MFAATHFPWKMNFGCDVDFWLKATCDSKILIQIQNNKWAWQFLKLLHYVLSLTDASFNTFQFTSTSEFLTYDKVPHCKNTKPHLDVSHHHKQCPTPSSHNIIVAELTLKPVTSDCQAVWYKTLGVCFSSYLFKNRNSDPDFMKIMML